MNKLEQELQTAAQKPKMSAVKFSKANESVLTKDYGITRQRLRDVAVLVDKQVLMGFAFKVKEVKAVMKKSKKKIPKVELVEKPLPVKKKGKPKPKKAVAKKKSKKKS